MHLMNRLNIAEYRLTRLRQLIREHGSQSALAEKLGCTPSFINQVLSGKKSLSEKMARKYEESLGLASGWFDHRIDNVTKVSNETRSRVPLLNWSDVEKMGIGNTIDIGRTDVKDWLPMPNGAGQNTYALKVTGDTMMSPFPAARSYPEGTIIFVDPDQPIRVGERGIFLLPEGIATFKQLTMDAGRSFLKPINPQYSNIELSDDVQQIGRVVGSYLPE